MVSSRCIILVKNELDQLNLYYRKVELGKVELEEEVANLNLKLQVLNYKLKHIGLELINDKKNQLVEKIKAAINELVYLSDDLPKSKFSDYISQKVNYDYTYLSMIFTANQGITIEKYIINQKIKRIKELLKSTKLSLIDITYKLQYSSVAHLCNQFKKITGSTPSYFRQRMQYSGQFQTQNV